MGIKEQFENINLLEKALQLFIAGSVVAGIVMGIAWAFGDNRYAPKEKTAQAIEDSAKALAEIIKDQELNNTLDRIHHDSTDLHMPSEVKRQIFVTRTEYEARSASINGLLERMESRDREFQAEQREVNREVRQILLSIKSASE